MTTAPAPPAPRRSRGPSTTTLNYAPDPALSYWPTPPEVAEDLLMLVLVPGYGDGRAGHNVPQLRVLEPSAGEGHLARVIRAHLPGAHLTCVEPDPARAAALRAAPSVADEVVESTLEDHLVQVGFDAMAGTWVPYDLIVANPPFVLEDRPEAWAEHLLALHDDPHLLAPGGQIGAVVPHIALTGQSKRVRAGRALTRPYGGIEACHRGAFDPVGAKVRTALLWLQAPFAPDPED